VIAEFSNVRHHDNETGVDYNSQAFYVQVGYRPPDMPKWKPYARFEKAISADDEPVMGNLTNWKATVGLRYELTATAALKVEYGHRRNLAWFLQTPPGTPDERGPARRRGPTAGWPSSPPGRSSTVVTPARCTPSAWPARGHDVEIPPARHARPSTSASLMALDYNEELLDIPAFLRAQAD